MYGFIQTIFGLIGDIADNGQIKLNILWPDVGLIHFSIKSDKASLKEFIQAVIVPVYLKFSDKTIQEFGMEPQFGRDERGGY